MGQPRQRNYPLDLITIGSVCLIIVLFSSPGAGQPQHQRLLFSHPLTDSQSDQGLTLQNTDGLFSAQGWQSLSATSQLFITLPQGLGMEGTFVVKVTHFDPYYQNINLKQPIIDLYSQPCGNKDIYQTDGAWFHLISGTGYQSGVPGEAGFKLWAAPRGVDSKAEERVMENARWDPNRSYEFKFIWSGTVLYFQVDGITRMQLPFAGQVEPFRYIFLGKDNLIYGYTAQPGPIFYDLRIYGPGEPIEEKKGPQLLKVQALAQDKVEVLFDRPVDPISSVQSDRFEITPGLSVSHVERRGDGNKLWLTTTAHQTNVGYTLYVRSIISAAAPPDTLTADSLHYTFRDLPVTAISRPAYRLLASRAAGDSVYSDRAYILTHIPDGFADYYWIQTANDDKGNTDAVFLECYAAGPLRIVLAIDAEGLPTPDWIQDWQPLQERITTDDTEFRLFAKEFPTGMVTLPGNGMSASSSMYLILLQVIIPTGVDLPPAPPTGLRIFQAP